MASIINGSIDLTKIPKEKIIIGKKGKYLPISITINDEQDQFDQDGPIIVQQSKEERDSKQAKTFLGNVNVVWSNGQNVEAKIKTSNTESQIKDQEPEDDLPF
jgi:hypothetical protein